VAEFGLLVGIAITALQTISLIAVEVRNRRYLEPTLLSLGVYLEVEAESCSKAHVTTTKTENTVWEFEFLQKTLNVLKHLLVRLFTVLGSIDADDLNLRELVQAVKATHVLTV
jgi:hypothetical protein